ncbi:MAG TPA: NUDIX domain-containing protein [bacterium]|nr:NUDIX domain-containing protein [bacterium]
MTEYWQELRKRVGHDPIIIPSAAGAILHDRKILLVLHKQKQLWQIPGGLQELDEKITDTIVREIKEELNVAVAVKTLVAVYSGKEWKVEFPNGDVVNQLLFFFLLDLKDPIENIAIRSAEIEKYAFFDLDSPPENIFPCCREKMRDLSDYRNGVIFK